MPAKREIIYAAIIAIFESFGLPTAILDAAGVVLAASDTLANCAPAIELNESRHLTFKSESTQVLFDATIAHYGRSGSAASAARSFALASTENHAAAIAHLLPLEHPTRVLLPDAAYLLSVSSLSGQTGLSTELLGTLFNLTPAEARVAKFIIEGRTVAEAAGELMVKENTIRIHLKSIFAKTGTHRQADLINLLASPLPSKRKD